MSRLLTMFALDHALPWRRQLAGASVIVFLFAQQAGASVTLDFSTKPNGDPIEHGRIVNDPANQFFLSDGSGNGVTISGENRGGGPDLIVAFNSAIPNTANKDTRDDDLLGPNWGNGNIDNTTVLGNILIIQENNWGTSDGIANFPDDEGSRLPEGAGSIIFDFTNPISEVGFDLVDIEGVDEFDPGGYVATFFMNGAALAQVGFDEFTQSGSVFYDPSVTFGDNSANRISPLTAAQLSTFTNTTISDFDRVEINLGGSGAVDNLTDTSTVPPSSSVPEASSILVWALLGLTVGSYKRRRRLQATG